MKGYYKLRKKALDLLDTQLPKDLFYHSIEHTKNVLKICNTYLKREKIKGKRAKLLRIGALTHDIGYIKSNENHEQTGTLIVKDMMQTLGIPKNDIRIVQELIMATKIPQSPKNELERILCDSDLDYLGRSDFYKISNKLYKELKINSFVQTDLEWNKLQIRFLEQHTYHTQFALKNRNPLKQKRIAELRKLVKQLEGG